MATLPLLPNSCNLSYQNNALDKLLQPKAIVVKKNCISCEKEIPQSNLRCPFCGKRQPAQDDSIFKDQETFSYQSSVAFDSPSFAPVVDDIQRIGKPAFEIKEDDEELEDRGGGTLIGLAPIKSSKSLNNLRALSWSDDEEPVREATQPILHNEPLVSKQHPADTQQYYREELALQVSSDTEEYSVAALDIEKLSSSSDAVQKMTALPDLVLHASDDTQALTKPRQEEQILLRSLVQSPSVLGADTDPSVATHALTPITSPQIAADTISFDQSLLQREEPTMELSQVSTDKEILLAAPTETEKQVAISQVSTNKQIYLTEAPIVFAENNLETEPLSVSEDQLLNEHSLGDVHSAMTRSVPHIHTPKPSVTRRFLREEPQTKIFGLLSGAALLLAGLLPIHASLGALQLIEDNPSGLLLLVWALSGAAAFVGSLLPLSPAKRSLLYTITASSVLMLSLFLLVPLLSIVIPQAFSQSLQGLPPALKTESASNPTPMFASIDLLLPTWRVALLLVGWTFLPVSLLYRRLETGSQVAKLAVVVFAVLLLLNYLVPFSGQIITPFLSLLLGKNLEVARIAESASLFEVLALMISQTDTLLFWLTLGLSFPAIIALFSIATTFLRDETENTSFLATGFGGLWAFFLVLYLPLLLGPLGLFLSTDPPIRGIGMLFVRIALLGGSIPLMLAIGLSRLLFAAKRSEELG